MKTIRPNKHKIIGIDVVGILTPNKAKDVFYTRKAIQTNWDPLKKGGFPDEYYIK